ncbi:LLM class flavin-dependent oxidoreductase [Candidatus Solirubrobacter pratensis]|uniref:LLM class flavin-dependent oxidoreductase n=1 Tax=Candidatus Solirubrobacter pratensis TaxID=1298857 RepID=UPI0004201E85|nr:LLM class flavin-dependent oxidoreductase [Candidatus Solirubrobacter pratensis]
MRWGLTIPFTGVPLADHGDLLRRAEALGYDDLWSAEATGVDGFTPLVLAAAWTERMRLGTAIVNPYTRGRALIAQSAAALHDASRGRFVLGLGSSSDVIVEKWNGVPFERPLARMRDAVRELRPVLAGERGRGGFKLEQPAPVPIFLAALRDRMLALAGEVGDGAILNFTPLSAVPDVVAAVGADVEIACRFFCFPDHDVAAAKRMLAAYATVPVYEAFFRAHGWGERIDPMVEAWNAGDRRRAAELAPEDLVREVFVFGSPEEQRERLGEFASAGIDTPILTPVCPPDRVGELLEAWAP